MTDSGPSSDAGDVAADGGEEIDGGTERDAGMGMPDGGAMMPLRACTMTVEATVQAVLDAAPDRDSEAFVPLAPAQLAQIPTLVDAVLTGEDDDAQTALIDVGYDGCRTPEGEVVLTPATFGVGGALVVLRPRASNHAVLEAPHPKFGVDTATIARTAFDRLDALGLLIAGTHRCANASPSGCDGTTTACGAPERPYPESDMAHRIDTGFHGFHVAVAEAVRTSTAVSIHGHAGNGAIGSNGTQAATSTGTPVARFVTTLKAERPADAVLTCNRFPGGAAAGQLCGTLNVQGRASNGISAACTMSATVATDRFLHLELSRAIRSDPESIITALDAALP